MKKHEGPYYLKEVCVNENETVLSLFRVFNYVSWRDVKFTATIRASSPQSTFLRRGNFSLKLSLRLNYKYIEIFSMRLNASVINLCNFVKYYIHFAIWGSTLCLNVVLLVLGDAYVYKLWGLVAIDRWRTGYKTEFAVCAASFFVAVWWGEVLPSRVTHFAQGEEKSYWNFATDVTKESGVLIFCISSFEVYLRFV